MKSQHLQPEKEPADGQVRASAEPVPGGREAAESLSADNPRAPDEESTPVSAPADGEPAGHRDGEGLPNWLLALALVLVTLLAYWPALRGGFIWDDDTHISENLALRSVSGLWDIWFKAGATCQYYPLTFTVFWLEYHLWSLHVFGYHLVNVLLHASAAVLLWQVLARLKLRGAWLAGAIFALHPVCVMSVAWMTELKNTLSATLALCAAWAYLRAAGLGVYGAGEAEGEQKQLNWRYNIVALALFVLALFAKTAVSFLPVTLLLVAWWCGRRLNWRTVWPVLPMFALAAGMGLLTIHVEQSARGGASGAQFHLTLLERALVSGRSFWFYLGKLFFPHQLTFIYERWTVNTGALWQYAFPAAAAGLLAGAWWQRGRIGKGAFAALAHFFVSTSLLILIVTLFFTSFSYVSDHWQYFGCMSVIAAAAAGIVRGLDSIGKGGRLPAAAVCGVLLLGLGLLTWRQCGMYRDLETLWTVTLERNPNCLLARNNYGALLVKEKRFKEAIAQFGMVTQSQPKDPLARYNLGNTLLQMGMFEEAAKQYQMVLEVEPDAVLARSNLGLLLLRRHKVDEAIGQFQKILEKHPKNAGAHYNLATALVQKGKLDEAILQLQTVVEIDSTDYEARGDLANLLFRQGRVDEAAAQLRKALEIQPAYADGQNDFVRMAWALATSPEDSVRNGPKALELAQELVGRSGGKNPLHLSILAAATAETGKYEEAAATAERAQKLAVQQGNTGLATSLNGQINSYRSGKPYHETAPRPAPGPTTPTGPL